MKNQVSLPLVFIIALIMAGIGGFVGYSIKKTALISTTAIRQNNTSFKFIHPLLAVGRPDGMPTVGYESLAADTRTYINSAKDSGKVDTASVYFINYGKGGSFSINEAEPYYPASLMKVVIMVAYLKKADKDPSILRHSLIYTKNYDDLLDVNPFDEKSSLVIGKPYTIEQLIDSMIIDSDNGAMNLLLGSMDDTYLSQVYVDLGISQPEVDRDYTISAKDYSLFFRILYNGTYISPINSERALATLAKATFKEGLVAGLPKGSVVAHKYGEHVLSSGGAANGFDLHDCGLIYNDNGTYLLCVMTKGKKLDDLKSTIAGIANIVSTAVAEKNK
jgi:beta-lactamase class A